MNWLEQIQGEIGRLLPIDGALIDRAPIVRGLIEGALTDGALSVGLLIVGAVVVIVLAFRHYRRVGVRLARMEKELIVYTEASTRVAESLEALLMGRTRISQSLQSSRRYLLLQARERLERGESPQGIARGLGLSHDEVRLLERTGPSGQARDLAATQHPRAIQKSRERFARPVYVDMPEGSSLPEGAASPDERQRGHSAG